MRILKFFFAALLISVVLGAAVVLVVREIVLVVGASMLAADYKNLQGRSYGQTCVGQYGYAQEYFTQIRFLTNKEYVKEVVCADFTSTPILLESKKLPIFLFKTSMGSGFVLDERDTPLVVELRALGRKIFIYTEEGRMQSSYLRAADLDYELGPVSSCQAHDYQCCNLEVQSGVGEQLTRVNDCPKSCYESCLLRPVVLALNTRPYLDPETRIVEARSGEAVSFSYVIGDGSDQIFAGQIQAGEQVSLSEKLQVLLAGLRSGDNLTGVVLPVTVTLDFGDGEIWQSNNLQDSADHQYACASQTCYFQVKLSVSDAAGVLSVDNDLSKMRVRVDR
jgi:hypothetical protein